MHYWCGFGLLRSLGFRRKQIVRLFVLEGMLLSVLASAIGLQFQRLQFTPDMLPADIVGTMIYNPRDGSFSTKHGPIFSNLILADAALPCPDDPAFTR